MNLIKGILLIPIMSALFRLGGWGKYPFFCMNAKYWRWWGMGIVVSLFYWTPIPFIAYWLSTSVPYGDNSWLKKIVGRDANWMIYGFLFGFSSLSVLSLGFSSIGGLLTGISFWGLMKLSNDGIGEWKLDHKYVELGTGAVGAVMYLFK